MFDSMEHIPLFLGVTLSFGKYSRLAIIYLAQINAKKVEKGQNTVNIDYGSPTELRPHSIRVEILLEIFGMYS